MPDTEDALLDNILNDRPINTAPVQQPQTEEPGNAPVANEPQTTNEPAAAAPVVDPVTPTPANPESQEAPTTASWINEASKSIGIEIKSEEELKSLIAKANSYGDLEGRFNTTSQELEKVKTERPELANDYIRIKNEMYLQGRSAEDIQAFEKINSVGELKELAPLETMKLALQLRDGLTPEEADIRLKSLYKLDSTVFDADIVAESQVNLKLDSKKDAEYLEQFKAKVSENPAKAQQLDYEKQVREYTEKVTPIAKSIQDSLTVIKGIPVSGKAGTDLITLDIPVSEESRATISDLVTQYAVAQNIPVDSPQGIESLRDFANNVAWIANKENIARHIAAKTEERIRAEFHNPSNIDRGPDAPNNSAQVAEKQMLDFVLGS